MDLIIAKGKQSLIYCGLKIETVQLKTLGRYTDLDISPKILIADLFVF